MTNIHESEIRAFIEDTTSPDFFKKKIAKLKQLTLLSILARKNPYLYKAKGCDTPEKLIHEILEAGSSSGEEGIFGNLLEQLAIFVCQKAYSGWKSGIKGIDLEFDKDGFRYLVSIKSGPKWGNADSIAKLKENFKKAIGSLGTSGGVPKSQIKCIEGCCYGKEATPKDCDHEKVCGQEFWTLISGNASLYKTITHAFGQQADLERYAVMYEEKKADLVKEFVEKFCPGGVINWELLVEHNSGASRKSL